MSNYKKFLAEKRRLTILRILADVNLSANDFILHDALRHLGFNTASRDDVRSDINFMRERLLVEVEILTGLSVSEAVIVVSLTKAGEDVAFGRGDPIEGIARPGAGE